MDFKVAALEGDSVSSYSSLMLEHVALGQSRFMTPGVAPDPRGVVLGRYGILQFSTLEGVVSWFRLYSAESSLDELLPELQILRVRTPLQSRELLMRLPATTSYVMDRASRCAQLVGGSAYTGTAKHFVKYRDERSPYGYDAAEISALPAGAHLVLHGADFTQSYAKEGELAFDKLLFRLSLRRIPGAGRLADERRAELVLVVRRGLGEGVIRYLWRNRVEASVGLASPKGQSAFDELGPGRQHLVLRARNLPERILELFQATPGIDVFCPLGSNVAVQLGFEHVIDLSSCSTIFKSELFYLFWGQGDRVDVVEGPLELSSIEHLTRLEIDLETPREDSSFLLEAPEPVSVPLQLAPSLKPPTHVVGALVPLAQAGWLKRLVYLLPGSALRGHQVAITDRGILLVAAGEIDVIPLGSLLVELAPGLLIPAGMDLVPRVTPEVLAATLGHGAGVLTVFPPDGPPFQVAERALSPLERRTLARIEVDPAQTMAMAADELGTPSVVNDPVGRFALWGFPAPTEK